MPQVKILDSAPVVRTLFNAMCHNIDAQDILEKFKLVPDGAATTVEVVVTVNGVEVDFMGHVGEAFECLSGRIDEYIKEEAAKLFTDKADQFRDAARDLEAIADQIEVLNWKARKILNKVED